MFQTEILEMNIQSVEQKNTTT